MDESFNRKRWGIVFFGTIVLMFAGLIYAWSNLSSPLKDFGWTETELTFTYTLTITAFAIGGVISGVLSKKLSVKARLIPSAALMVFGFWMVSFMNKGDNIAPLYIGYGIFAGTSIGVIYNAVISSVNLWFPDKKGVCSGILLTGFGLGSFFIGLISGELMANGVAWQSVYRVLGTLAGAVILGGAFLIPVPGPDDKLPEARTAKVVHDNVLNFRPAEMLKTSSFWLMFFLNAFLAGIGGCVIPISKQLVLTTGVVESTAILLSSLVSVTNSLGRLAAGTIIDKLGLRSARNFSCIVATLGCALTVWGVATANAIPCAIGIFICGFSYGFPGTLATTGSLEFYGPKNYSLNYSILNSDSFICGFFPTIFTAISAAGGSYNSGFMFLIAVGVVTFTAGLFIRRPKLIPGKQSSKEVTE